MGAFSYLRDHKNINQVRKGAFEKQNKVKLGRKDLIHSCNFIPRMTVHSWDSICIYVHNSEQIGGAIEEQGSKLSTGKSFETYRTILFSLIQKQINLTNVQLVCLCLSLHFYCC